jgi:hypothetical protein
MRGLGATAMREFILLRQRDGAWTLFGHAKAGDGLFWLASGIADWDPVEARWTRPASSDYATAERASLSLDGWRGRPVPQSFFAN